MQKYISVNENNQSSQVVKLQNELNEFKGNIYIPNDNDEFTDIKDLFSLKSELENYYDKQTIDEKLDSLPFSDYVTKEEISNGFKFDNIIVNNLLINGNRPISIPTEEIDNAISAIGNSNEIREIKNAIINLLNSMKTNQI